MKDEKLYLIHISECIGRIESYTNKLSKDAFMKSDMVQDAVVRNLQIMSESTQRLSEKTKQTQPQIDWFKIVGFRNVLVHDYLGIDPEKIWNIIQKELPTLKMAVSEMMR